MSVRRHSLLLIALLIAAALCGSCYQVATKSLPSFRHPFASLTVTYFVAGILCCIAWLVLSGKKRQIGTAFRTLNWKSYFIGVMLVGVDGSIFYIYARFAGGLAETPLILSAAQTLFTLMTGVLFFSERPRPSNCVGMLLCIAGAFMAAM